MSSLRSADPEVRPIVCDWDASSRRGGPGGNGPAWRDLLTGVRTAGPIVLNRRLGEVLPAALTATVADVLVAGDRPLVLGGDHRLSYSALTAVAHTVGPVDVELFDAHHDAHPGQVLSNFTVFRFVVERLGLGVARHGCREDRPPAPLQQFPPAGRAYLSVDLDYLDPAGFGSVNFPVPVPVGMTCTPRTLSDGIRAVAAGRPVIGCDLVEWCAERATDAERTVVAGVLADLVGALRSSAPVAEPQAG